MKILYIVKYNFPKGDAGALRAHNLCRLLFCAGHSVHVLAGRITDENVCADCCTFEGERENASSIWERHKRRKANVKKLECYLRTSEYGAILSEADEDIFWKLVRLRDKYNVKLIIAIGEWYHVSSYRLWYFDPRYYQMLIMFWWGLKRADGFISISRLLDNYVSSIGKKSVRIPSIFNTSEIIYELNTDNPKLILVYAGDSGVSKELFAPIVVTLASDNYLRNNIELHIFGPDEKTVRRNVNNDEALEKAKGSIVIHGRVEHEVVIDRIRRADYMFFIRPNRKSSNAGFPTKMAECMALGTPPITNDTGDISLYLKMWENGVLLEELNEKYIGSVFYRLFSLDRSKKRAMREGARKTAERYFDYRNYLNEIELLLS